MDVVRQDVNVSEQRVFVRLEEHRYWEISYSHMGYPHVHDMPREAVLESLNIVEAYPNNFPNRSVPGKEGYFGDTIFLDFDGKISTNWSNLGMEYSPVLAHLKRSSELREKIRTSLSTEARDLFDKGLESYTGPTEI